MATSLHRRATVLSLLAALLLSGCVSIAPAAPAVETATVVAPANMQSYGFALRSGELVLSPEAGEQPSAVDTAGSSSVTIYMDPMCPHCETFFLYNQTTLETLLSSSPMLIEIRPVAFVPPGADGASTRLTTALMAVADRAPEQFPEVFRALIAEGFPSESEVTDEMLADFLHGTISDVAVADAVIESVKSGEYAEFAAHITEWATSHPAPDGEAVSSVPSVYVNDGKYTGATDDTSAFDQFIIENM